MAVNGFTNIVTDGLVLSLDAGNLKSYPTTGTTWTDLIKNGNNGTLTNMGVTGFSSSNLGSLVFDGVDDYVGNVGGLSSFSFIQNTNIFSINFWFKINSLNTRNVILGNTPTTAEKGFFLAFEYLTSYGFNALSFYSVRGSSGNLTCAGTTNDNIITNTNWHHGCFVNNNTTTGQWYVDGLLTTTTSRYNPADINAPDGILSTGDSTRTLNIGRANFTSTIIPLKGNISNVQIYNRALSTSEVLQNYNATKWRFI